RADQWTEAEDERRLGGERINARRSLTQQQPGPQADTPQKSTEHVLRQWHGCDRAMRQIDPQVATVVAVHITIVTHRQYLNPRFPVTQHASGDGPSLFERRLTIITLTLLLVALSFHLLRELAVVFQPLLVAGLITYMAVPLHKWLVRHG